MSEQELRYRIRKAILEQAQGEVVRLTMYKSVNAAKKANRGNCTPPVEKPNYSEHCLRVGPL